MPEIRDDNAICFVQGHGAKYSSSSAVPAETKADAIRQRLLSPLMQSLARKRAAAQLALQRVAGKKPDER